MHPALLRRPERLPTDGLVALYDMVQDPANPQRLTDRSGNGRHGTLGGTAAADSNDPAWVAGGLTFDGVDDYVQTPTGVAGAEFTLVAVAASTSMAVQQRFFSRVTTTNTLRFAPGGQLQWQWADGSQAGVTTLAGPTVAANTPVFVAAAYSVVAGIGTLHCNGTRVSSVSAGFTANASTYRLGDSGLGTIPLAGRMHYAAIYSRALSDAEIARSYRVIRRQLAQRGVILP